MVLASITSLMGMFTRECGILIRDMDMVFTIIRMVKFIGAIITMVREMDLVYSTTRMAIDMKGIGRMEILMGLGPIIILLGKCMWGCIRIIREMEGAGMSIRMGLFMRGIGNMGIRKGLGVISMVMAFIWESVMLGLDMGKVFTCSKMDHVMKGLGSRVNVKVGESTNTLTPVSILESIRTVLEMGLACTSTLMVKCTKVTGKETKRTALA